MKERYESAYWSAHNTIFHSRRFRRRFLSWRKSRRARELHYSISGKDSYQPDVFRRSNSREGGTSNFFFLRSEPLEIRIRVNRKSWSTPVIQHHEQDEDTVHLRRRLGLPSFIVVCPYGTRETQRHIHHCNRAYRVRVTTYTKPVYRPFFPSEPENFLRLLPPGCASFAFHPRPYVIQDVR